MQGYVKVSHSLHRASGVPADCVLLALSLMSYGTTKKRNVKPSIDTLQAQLPRDYQGRPWGRKRVVAALGWLTEQGFFEGKKRRYNNSTVYVLRPEEGEGSIVEWVESLAQAESSEVLIVAKEPRAPAPPATAPRVVESERVAAAPSVEDLAVRWQEETEATIARLKAASASRPAATKGRLSRLGGR